MHQYNKLLNLSEIQEETIVPRFIIERPIILIGMMACGKSTIGSVLSKALGIRFYDSDKLIEKDARNSVASIFEIWGESIFRSEEVDLISRIFDENHKDNKSFILSTGDGSFCSEEIRTLIYKYKAITVWIESPIEMLYERISRRVPQHPILRQGENLYDAIDILTKTRESSYAQADIKYTTKNHSSRRESVEKLLKVLEEFTGGTNTWAL